MPKKHRVFLKPTEVTQLKQVISSGVHRAQTITRARILLLANEQDGKGISDREIIHRLQVSATTPQDVRYRYAAGGLSRALYDAPRPGKPVVFTPQDRATVTAVACTTPPVGYGRWTMTLIRDETIKRIGKHIGRTKVNKILLENKMKPHLKKNVVHQNY